MKTHFFECSGRRKQRMTTLIDITKYKTKFEAYPADFESECKKNKIKLPGIDSLAGQAYALMAQPEIRGQKHLGREETDVFFKNIGIPTTDSIQPFNKTSQYGLVRLNLKKGYYCLAYPFEFNMTDVQKRTPINVAIAGDRDEQINSIKNWWKVKVVDVPNKEWQIGHLDPTREDGPVAYQPPLQGKYKDRFKFDELFHKMWPTAKELISKPDDYYTETEQKMLYDALKPKFEKHP